MILTVGRTVDPFTYAISARWEEEELKRVFSGPDIEQDLYEDLFGPAADQRPMSERLMKAAELAQKSEAMAVKLNPKAAAGGPVQK